MVIVDIKPRVEYVKPHIEEKAYTGVCREIKQFKDAEGNEKVSVNQYGNENMKLIFQFDLFEIKTGAPVVENDLPVSLSAFATYLSRKKGDEEWNSIIGSSKAQITGIVTALGLELKSDMDTKYDLNELVGKTCKIYVKDYTKKDADGTETTFSVIGDISKFNAKDLQVFKEPVPNKRGEDNSSSSPAPKPKAAEPKVEEDSDEIETIDMSGDENEKKLKDLKSQLDKGLITQKGYDMAVEQLTGLDSIDLGDE